MRLLLTLLALAALSACTTSTASMVDSRTFRIEGPGVPGGSSAPNRRQAEAVCPNGYRVLSREVHRGGPNAYTDEPGVFTDWTIRCL
jgi:hypothetical protein